MKTYKIYSARLEYGKYNRYKGTYLADDVKECIEKFRKPFPDGGLNLNPFYAVIVEVSEDGKTKIVHNEHLSFCEE